MNIEELRDFCLSLPAVTEDIKWGEHLVFSVAGKIFCLTGLEPPLQVALKVPEEQFDELTLSGEITQASHFARRQWMTVLDESRFSRAEWEHYIRQSYHLVIAKLPVKTRQILQTTKDRIVRIRSISAVIAAAGNSERMGCDKALLSIGHGKTFAGHLMHGYRLYGCRPVVLVVNENTDISQLQQTNILTVINHQVHLGRSHSIRLGLSHIPVGSECFIHNVDNPFLKPDLLDRLLELVQPDAYVVPVFEGRGGHPVLLGRQVADHIRSQEHPADFREALSRFKRMELPFPEENILWNINTPEEYQKFILSNHP